MKNRNFKMLVVFLPIFVADTKTTFLAPLNQKDSTSQISIAFF